MRNAKFFKARQDMAIAISEKTFRLCEQSENLQPKTETVEQFLKRGGKITNIPPERRFKK